MSKLLADTFRALRVGVVATCALLVPLAASAQEEPPLPKAKIFEEPDEGERKARPPERKGPTFKLDTARTKRESKSAEIREEVIQTLLETLQIQDPTDSDYPQLLVRLADEYWQKGDDYSDAAQSEDLLRKIWEAEEAKDTAALQRLRVDQQRLLDEQRKWRQQAINTYQQIERDHPDYKDLDTVLYSLGYHLTLIGQPDQGYQYYSKLVLQRPTSPLIPDTLLNIGDYFFGHRNDFQQALDFYSKVQQFGETRVEGYAIYKSAWCWFNLDDKAKAMNLFYDTIKWTRKAEKQGHVAALDLRGEAQVDMVRAYSFIGAPNKAVAFFKKIAPEIYIDLCEKLGDIYTADANYNGANRLYRSLIEEIGDDYRVLKYQREIVYNTFKAGDKDRTKEEIGAMSDMLATWMPKLPQDFEDDEMKELEMLLRVVGTDYHREAESTLERPTQLLALFVYEQYLRWFPDANDYYTMTFNVALLAYQMQEYERAANLFEKVIELKPEGQHLAVAAHTALLSYYKLVEIKAPEEKQRDGSGEELEKDEIPTMQQKLITACERYLKLAPEEAEDRAEARYAAGVLYYMHNHFEPAEKHFIALYESHRSFAQILDAAKMLLTIYNVQRDIDNIEKYAGIFAADPNLAKGDFKKILDEIEQNKDFNACWRIANRREHGEAGDCFMAYFKKHEKADPQKGIKALKNAAIQYKDAKDISSALVASEYLYNNFQDPQALYNIGSIYKAIAVYSESAYYYELYAKKHGDHNRNLLQKALARAAQYRRALGQYDEAIDNYVDYYKKFKKDDDAGDVFFEIGLIYENQEDWRGVLRHFTKYLRSHGKEAPVGHVIAAHTKMGIAHWKSGRRKPALDEFATALEQFNALQEEAKAKNGKAEISEGGIDAVAAAKFHEGEVVLEEMKKVQLRLPQRIFTERLQKKVELIGEATDRMSEVAQFERPHWEIAAFNRIGQAYQNLSEAIESAPLPRNMPEEEKWLVREEFQKKANEVRGKAIEAYRICLDRAKTKQWFNEFSDNAEKNLAKLDLEYKGITEVRPQPVAYRPNGSVPQLLEGPKPSPTGDKEKDKLLTPYFREALAAADEVRDWKGDSAGVGKVTAAIEAHKAQAPAVAAYNLGLVDMHQGRLTAALEKFQQAAQQDANLDEAHAMMGVVKLKLGQPGAEAHFEQAKSLAKFNPMALNVEAERAQASQGWTDSIALSRKALIGNAESMNAYQNLARAYFQTGQYDLARLVCQQALEFQPHNAALRNLLGLTYLKLDNVRAALRQFVRATEGNPHTVEGHLNLASTVLNYADFERASKHFARVLEIEEENRDAKLGLAVAHRGLEKYDDAIAGYDALLARNAQDADVLYDKCQLLTLYQGKWEEGAPVCESYIASAPEDHVKREEMDKRIQGIRDTAKILKEQRLAEEAEKLKQQQGPDGQQPAPESEQPQEGDPDAAPGAEPTPEAEAPAEPAPSAASTGGSAGAPADDPAPKRQR